MSASFTIEGSVYPAQSGTLIRFDRGITIQNVPAKRVAKFGDGYSMHIPLGPIVRTYNVAFNNRPTSEIEIIETYFTLLKGEPFYISIRGESIRVVVLDFNKNYQNGEIYSLTAKLKETFVYDIYDMLSDQTAAALFDIDDITSLRVGTDGSGGVPAEGDPVGTMMDVSGTGGKTMTAYLEGATELVTNGTFDTDTDWTKGAGWTIAGGVASCDGTQVSTSYFYQACLTVGELVKVTVDVTDITSGTPRIQLGNTFATVNLALGENEIIGVVSGNSNLIFGALVGAEYTIDNVSVKPLPGYVATAPSDAARPTLQQDAGSGKYYLDFDGTDDNMILEADDIESSTNATLYKTFRADSTDTTQIMFGTNGGVYLLAAQSGSSSTSLSAGLGSPVYREDGTIPSYATRGDIFTALVDDTDHTIGVEEADLSASGTLAANGFYIGGEYSTTWDNTGRLYAWAVVDTKLSVTDRNILESWMLGKKP